MGMPRYLSNTDSNPVNMNSGLYGLAQGIGNEVGGRAGGLGQLLSGLFGNSGGAYSDAMKQYQKYLEPASQNFNPFIQAGQGAIDPYQRSINTMRNPLRYMENIFSQYQQSPQAQNLQRDSLNAANNAASASGLMGSTPLQMAAQQGAHDISSQDMQQYLQNALGIQGQHQAGLQNLMQGGLQGAQGQGNILSQLAQLMGEGAYGKKAGAQNDTNNIISGFLSLLFGGK